MPNYRRASVPGGVFFLTVVTHRREPLFRDPANVGRLRSALRLVKHERPFTILGAAVLPDHLHFLWSLPRGDADFSTRIGRMKVLLTRSCGGPGSASEAENASRRRHRERGVWQRRFWEHCVQAEDELESCLHYIHANPVKRGLVSCPHLWPASSFRRWVRDGLYPADWGCRCAGRTPVMPRVDRFAHLSGE